MVTKVVSDANEQEVRSILLAISKQVYKDTEKHHPHVCTQDYEIDVYISTKEDCLYVKKIEVIREDGSSNTFFNVCLMYDIQNDWHFVNITFEQMEDESLIDITES